ncbi:MAG: DUF1365 domain-containing protein [Planctomycetota bacterium]
MKSCLYEGQVRHRRFGPVAHDFTARVLLFYVDLAELDAGLLPWIDTERRWAPFRLLRADHVGGPAEALEESIRTLVAKRTGHHPTGPIRLLTHLRCFGHCFNPVSFFYVFSADDRTVETIVAEVSNTPWRERHLYLVTPTADSTGSRLRERFPKEFHVSPFMGMDLEYDWSFSAPGRRLAAHFVNLEAGTPLFDATLSLTRKPCSRRTLLSAMVRYPFLSQRVLLAIYWQAFRLWWKKAPFFPHPKHRQPNPLPDPDGRAA